MCKTSENINIPEGQLCEYGCGKLANYKFKCGKYCCSRNQQECSRKKCFRKILKKIKNKNGKCLSKINDYKTQKSKLKFICYSHNHVWETTASPILLGSWCRKCANERMKKRFTKYTIEDLIKKAQSFGGKCLSSEYVNYHSEYDWECSNGHFFKKKWSKIKSAHQWCPYCKNNVTEEMCRFIFEQLTGKKFPTKSINKIIKNLELDGYCEELNLSFEYQGEQHYREVNTWHKRCSLKNQKKRDIQKRYRCKKIGIRLIVIPFRSSKTKENIEKYILKKLLYYNFDIVKTKCNWDEFSYGNNTLNEIKKLCENKNYKLLSKTYIRNNENLEIECPLGHIFEKKYVHLKRNQWCPYCSGRKVCEDNCLKTVFPKIANEWHPTKNGDLTPSDVFCRSCKKVWWINEKRGEFQAVIEHRIDRMIPLTTTQKQRTIQSTIYLKGRNQVTNPTAKAGGFQ